MGSLEKQMENIGVVWDVLSGQWENNYRLLVKFQQREGHCNVPQRHKEDGTNLGFWLNRQRRGKKKGEHCGLEKQLDDIGVVWDALSGQWENNYRLLIRFQQREGHCNVPHRHKEEGMNLGKWLERQRRGRKKEELDGSLEKWLERQRRGRKKEELDGSLEKRMEDIGVVWDVLSEQCGNNWENNYCLLIKFQHREGHCNVPVSHKEGGKNLGVWLSRQQKEKEKGELDDGLEKRLEDIGVVLDVL